MKNISHKQTVKQYFTGTRPKTLLHFILSASRMNIEHTFWGPWNGGLITEHFKNPAL